MVLPLRPPRVVWSALTPWLAVCGRATGQGWDAVPLTTNTSHLHCKPVCTAGVTNAFQTPPAAHLHAEQAAGAADGGAAARLLGGRLLTGGGAPAALAPARLLGGRRGEAGADGLTGQTDGEMAQLEASRRLSCKHLAHPLPTTRPHPHLVLLLLLRVVLLLALLLLHRRGGSCRRAALAGGTLRGALRRLLCFVAAVHLRASRAGGTNAASMC